jgi:hypothetical protein
MLFTVDALFVSGRGHVHSPIEEPFLSEYRIRSGQSNDQRTTLPSLSTGSVSSTAIRHQNYNEHHGIGIKLQSPTPAPEAQWYPGSGGYNYPIPANVYGHGQSLKIETKSLVDNEV